MVQDEFDDTTVAVYDGLLTQALREIRSPAATPGQRIAWADAAEFALEHLPDTEARVAETLSIAARTLHSPGVVSRLIAGVWSCTGCRSYDGTRKRLLGWVINLADRAVRGEHWATFAWLAHTTIRLDGVERELPAEWERGIRAAYNLPSTWVSLYLFAYHYGGSSRRTSRPRPTGSASFAPIHGFRMRSNESRRWSNSFRAWSANEWIHDE